MRVLRIVVSFQLALDTSQTAVCGISLIAVIRIKADKPGNDRKTDDAAICAPPFKSCNPAI